jgi:hypothetical protein
MAAAARACTMRVLCMALCLSLVAGKGVSLKRSSLMCCVIAAPVDMEHVGLQNAKDRRVARGQGLARERPLAGGEMNACEKARNKVVRIRL